MFSTDLISQIVVGEEKHADCRPCRMGLGKDTTTPKVKTKVIQNNITVPKMGISGPYVALFILRGLSPYRQGYMQLYLNEADFRYNSRKMPDSERTVLALRAVEGKRLKLREPKRAPA